MEIWISKSGDWENSATRYLKWKHFISIFWRNEEKLDLKWTLEGHQLGVVSVDISHTGTVAASSSLDAHIRIWDLDTGKQIKSIDAGPGKFLWFLVTCVVLASRLGYVLYKAYLF